VHGRKRRRGRGKRYVIFEDLVCCHRDETRHEVLHDTGRRLIIFGELDEVLIV